MSGAEGSSTSQGALPGRIEDEFGVPMALIPAGSFQMGSDEGNDNEKPAHTVYLDAFYMDIYEVTNQLFADFLKEMGNQVEGGVIHDVPDGEAEDEEAEALGRRAARDPGHGQQHDEGGGLPQDLGANDMAGDGLQGEFEAAGIEDLTQVDHHRPLEESHGDGIQNQ